jgi:glycine/D-amino acid oxidase-like deaminating enzyme
MLRVFHENPEHIDLALGHHKHLGRLEKEGTLPRKSKPNGSLYFFNRSRLTQYESGLKKMNAAKYPFEILNPIEGRKRFPEYRWNSEELAIYEVLGDQIDPKLFLEKLYNTSLSFPGIAVLNGLEVQRICPYQSRYRVSAHGLTLTSKSLILSGGASFLPRLRDFGLKLPLESRSIEIFIANKAEKNFRISNYFDRETIEFGGFGHPDNVILSHIRQSRVVKELWKQEFGKRVAYDCYAPNRKGFLGQISGHSGLFIATGWGGTAFKFSLEVGHRMGRIIENTLLKKRG